jgi:hypothetical protein
MQGSLVHFTRADVKFPCLRIHQVVKLITKLGPGLRCLDLSTNGKLVDSSVMRAIFEHAPHLVELCLDNSLNLCGEFWTDFKLKTLRYENGHHPWRLMTMLPHPAAFKHPLGIVGIYRSVSVTQWTLVLYNQCSNKTRY